MVQLFKSKDNLYLDQILQTTLNNLIFQGSCILLNKIRYYGGIKIAPVWVDTNSHYNAYPVEDKNIVTHICSLIVKP